MPFCLSACLCACPSPQHPGFTTPLVPWLPAIGACFNWFLLAQLTWDGIAAIALYIAAAILVYFLYGYRRSVGARTG